MRCQLLASFLLLGVVIGSAKATLDFLDPFLGQQDDRVRGGGGAGLGGGLAASGSVGSGLGNNLGFDASGSLAASKSLDLGGNNLVQPLQPQIIQEWPRWSLERQCWLDEFGRIVPAPRQVLPQQRPIIQTAPIIQQVPIQQTPPCDHNVRPGVGPVPRVGPNNRHFNNGPNYQRHGRSQKDKMDEKMMEEMKHNSTKNETDAGGQKRSTHTDAQPQNGPPQDGGPVLVIEHIQLIPLFNRTNVTTPTDPNSPQKRAATSSQEQQLPVNTEVHFTSLNVTTKVNATNATSGADRTVSPKLSGVANMFHNIMGA